MANANRSTRSEVILDSLDALGTTITQSQSIIVAVRADVGSPDGGALTRETLRNLLWAADGLLDRAREQVERLQVA